MPNQAIRILAQQFMTTTTFLHRGWSSIPSCKHPLIHGTPARHIRQAGPTWNRGNQLYAAVRASGSVWQLDAAVRAAYRTAGVVEEVGCRPDDASARITGLPVVWHPSYSAPQLAPGHRFPMQVFGRIYQQLLDQNIIEPHQVHVPPSLPSRQQLCLVHTHEYVDAFRQGTLDAQRTRRIGFGEAVRSPVLITRTQAEVAGTLLTARLALRTGLAVNTAGGTHHAFPDAGSGYCILNDLAVTAKVLLEEGAVQRVLILDLDVHQGDGTAVCRQDEPRAYTLSFHAESNFPARKQRSSRDVGLADGTDDATFMRTLAQELPAVMQEFKPDLVLYDAGVDVHAADALGRLSLTDQGLARREALVLDTCLSHAVPVAGYVGGGYADDLEVLAARHVILHRTAAQFWKEWGL